MSHRDPVPTPPLTRSTAREARQVLAKVRPEVLPDGRLKASYEVHGMAVTEIVHPDRRNPL